MQAGVCCCIYSSYSFLPHSSCNSARTYSFGSVGGLVSFSEGCTDYVSGNFF